MRTQIDVRVIAKGGKYLGDDIGGALVTVQDVQTGELLAKGTTAGGSGERATLVPDEGFEAHGVLFSLTPGEVDALYSEDSVSAYRPEAVCAQLADGTAVPALCFNLPAPPAAGERNPLYASKLRELAARLGLPADYVSSIE